MSRAFLELIRLPAVFSAPADVLGAMAFVLFLGSAPTFSTVFMLASVSLLLYMSGMITNDIFDVEVDRIERPSRPLPSGRISLSSAWRIAVTMQVCALAVASLVSLESGACALAVCLLTYLYNGVTKSTAFGPFAMGLCRGGNFCLGLSILPNFGFGYASWLPCLVIILYVSNITWVSRYEVGPRTQRGVLAARILRLSGLLAFGYLPLAQIGSWNWVAVVMLLVWLNFNPKAQISSVLSWFARPISGALKMEVIRGLGGILVLYASLCLLLNQYTYALFLLFCLFLARQTGRWFYAT